VSIFKMDYVQPLNDSTTLEVGTMSTSRWVLTDFESSFGELYGLELIATCTPTKSGNCCC
jgi:hypothetical protein